jgi:sulfopyruvate decarboxylase subunit alpha
VDALPFAQRFIEAAPDRAIWCTDWPHVQYPKPMPNDAELLEFLYRVAPDAEQRRKILAANPARLFGFSDPPAWVRQESEGKHEHTHADAPAATSIDSLTESDDKVELKGSPIVAAIKASGVEFVISVPDIVTSAGVLRPIADDPELKLIRVSKEDECIGIASGLHYYDKRALSLIQHTGFLDSINAIRGVAVEHAQPICMMIGLLEYDSRRPPRDSSRYGVRIIEPILDAMGIPHHLINQDADVARIRTAIEDAYATSHPVALLIGRRPSAS